MKYKLNLWDCSQAAVVIFLLVLPFLHPEALHGYHNIYAVFHLATDRMLAVRPLSFVTADEKLGSVVLGPAFAMDKMPEPICFRIISPHRQICRLDPYGLEVTTLAYESWNNYVKAGTFITKSFLPIAQSTKVFCCLWNFVCKELEGDKAQGLLVNSDVENTVGLTGQQRLQGCRLLLINFPLY